MMVSAVSFANTPLQLVDPEVPKAPSVEDIDEMNALLRESRTLKFRLDSDIDSGKLGDARGVIDAIHNASLTDREEALADDGFMHRLNSALPSSADRLAVAAAMLEGTISPEGNFLGLESGDLDGMTCYQFAAYAAYKGGLVSREQLGEFYDSVDFSKNATKVEKKIIDFFANFAEVRNIEGSEPPDDLKLGTIVTFGSPLTHTAISLGTETPDGEHEVISLLKDRPVRDTIEGARSELSQ